MSALRFDVDLEWRADQIVGEITVGGVRTTVSEPRLMGGTGVRMSLRICSSPRLRPLTA
jgi:hypothetical protein